MMISKRKTYVNGPYCFSIQGFYDLRIACIAWTIKNKLKIIYLRTIQTGIDAYFILEFVCIMDNIKTDDLRIENMYSFKICTKKNRIYIIEQLENMKKFCNVFA